MRKVISCLLATVLLVFCIVPITASAADPLTIEAEKITIVPTLDGTITEKEWGKPFYDGDPSADSVMILPADIKSSIVPKNIKLYVRWTDSDLYIGAVVEHQTYFNNYTGSKIWEADSFELDICVDSTNQAARWRTNTGYSTTDGKTYSYVYGIPNNSKDGVDGTELVRSKGRGTGVSVAGLKDKTVTYEMSFPWSYFGAGATIKTGHSLKVNFQFYLADGTKSSTYFENSTYLGSVYYGNKDGNNKGQYPVVKLIAEKNPPKVTSTAPVSSDEPESSKPAGVTVHDAPSSQTEVSSQASVSSETVTETAPTESLVEENNDEENGGFPLWAVIVIAVVGVVAIAAVTVLVLRKKK